MTGFNFGAMLSQNNQIKQIPLDMLVPFHNHQFSLYDGERRDDMVESIRKNGVMTPIVCRRIWIRKEHNSKTCENKQVI